MTIFAVLLPSDQPMIVAAIQREFPNDHLQVTPLQWLVSGSGTALSVTTKLGIYDPKNPTATTSGNAIVIAMSSYHGRAPTLIWDWIKSKLEGATGGE